MTITFLYLLGCLFIAIVVIILLTAVLRVHAFFALLIACFVAGIGLQIPVSEIISHIKDGFGNIMKSLGLIIVLGTTLGVLLEHTGSTQAMANFILKMAGRKRGAFAMSLTGFIVGLPIFCDSGYIVLNGINKSLAKQTGIAITVTSISLASGLYSVHCLIPPHPGATAAAATIGIDYGKLILAGIVVAIPAMFIGHIWSVFAGKRVFSTANPVTAYPDFPETQTPSVIKAFLPIIVPLLLIALKSFSATSNQTNMVSIIISAAGDPVIALTIGILLAFNCGRNWTKNIVSKLLQESAEKAGGILVIIGAGGAFGAVLASANIGGLLGNIKSLESMGLLFPFLVTFILKTAQGSSTVAIITAASIIQPLLPVLGLNDEMGKLFCVLAMGAGSMMISHANDAYFWVIAKFSSIEINPMLKVYSVASILMGVVSMFMVWLLSMLLS